MPSFWKSNRASKSHFFFPEQQQNNQQHTQQHPGESTSFSLPCRAQRTQHTLLEAVQRSPTELV